MGLEHNPGVLADVGLMMGWCPATIGRLWSCLPDMKRGLILFSQFRLV